MQDDKKHYDSDTLSQQRKAHEEFLKLKKMQSGEITDEAPAKIKPQTIEEKAGNFWYYYRWWIFGAIFLIFVITVCVKQCISRVDYDLSITVFTSTPVSDNDCEKIASYFEKYCDDVNSDGEVNVRVYNCSYVEGGNRQVAIANNTKVQAIITSESDALLFITDDTTFSYLNDISDTVNLLEENGVFLEEDFYSFCDTDDYLALPHNIKISRRTISKTTLQNDKKAKACYKEAGLFLNRLNSNGK